MLIYIYQSLYVIDKPKGATVSNKGQILPLTINPAWYVKTIIVFCQNFWSANTISIVEMLLQKVIININRTAWNATKTPYIIHSSYMYTQLHKQCLIYIICTYTHIIDYCKCNYTVHYSKMYSVT